ncbi:Crp/Fnr family transcriptional regulator [Paraburkholderia tagetis]|uniref:Crp/Fnr family transcriptional regulator n=1 Tax=Paraburkholderia tagetis TaxID=2913261 RepID=A0A9X1RPV2_9BURK|nr:Crp/Fnr family transcriptional regulator [Paraburkholderia tagetis]MCG5074525.1 Crp/Fnr family transcriptional regulator [Paraburkholderia tagetis]
MSADYNLEECLRQQFLFKSSDNSTIELARNSSRVVKVKADDYLVRQGDRASPLVILLSGQLRTCLLTEDGREIALHLLNAGDATGAASIIHGAPSMKSIVAVKASTVALINRADARRLFSEPGVAREVNAMFARLIKGTVENQTAIGTPRATARVCAIIYAMFIDSGADPAKPFGIPTHASLAAVAEVSRETVTRVLSSLARRNIIIKQGHQIIVTNPAALQQLATGVSHAPQDGKP